MKTVWIVSQGERHEGSSVQGVFEDRPSADERAHELREDRWFSPDVDYITVKEWKVNETV